MIPWVSIEELKEMLRMEVALCILMFVPVFHLLRKEIKKVQHYNVSGYGSPVSIARHDSNKAIQQTPPIIYHNSAHSIVFRDDLYGSNEEKAISQICEKHVSLRWLPIPQQDKLIQKEKGAERIGGKTDIHGPNSAVANFTPIIDPLPLLDFGPHDEFSELRHSSPFLLDESQLDRYPNKLKPNPEVWVTMTEAEKDVVTKLQQEKCVVKTVNNSCWNSFLQNFPIKKARYVGEMEPECW